MDATLNDNDMYDLTTGPIHLFRSNNLESVFNFTGLCFPHGPMVDESGLVPGFFALLSLVTSSFHANPLHTSPPIGRLTLASGDTSARLDNP